MPKPLNRSTSGSARTDTSVLTLITPTGDRQTAFALCEKWMARQDYPGRIQWIVVDDGIDSTVCTMDQKVIRRKPSKGHSLKRNLLAALPHVRGQFVLIIEDDDWYAPNYLRFMLKSLKDSDLVGEGRSRYYNVLYRRWRTLPNTKHASLCQTGFRRCIVPILKKVCENLGANRHFVDFRLWRYSKGYRRNVFLNRGLCVGIKGMPGRKGIGVGHRYKGGKSDPDLTKLIKWIGKDDAREYQRFYQNASQ